VPCLRGDTGETARHDDEAVVPAAALCPFVPDVLCGIVPDVDRIRVEGRELLANACFRRISGRFHLVPSSSTFSSIWRERKSACRTTKTSIRPMPPKSLKLTQVSVEKLNAT